MAERIDTSRVTGRREVRLATLGDLLADLARIETAAAEGRLRTLGNWSAAQVVQHIGKLFEFSLDGFSFRYPWYLRAGARLLRFVSWRWLLRVAFKPGFRNPAVAASLEPSPDVTLPEALAYLRRQVGRVQAGERMTQRSPASGPLNHEQWLDAQLRHAEMHLSFLRPNEDAVS